jgi:hypothetical protein
MGAVSLGSPFMGSDDDGESGIRVSLVTSTTLVVSLEQAPNRRTMSTDAVMLRRMSSG